MLPAAQPCSGRVARVGEASGGACAVCACVHTARAMGVWQSVCGIRCCAVLCSMRCACQGHPALHLTIESIIDP